MPFAPALTRLAVALAITTGLAGCATSSAPAIKTVYDFGTQSTLSSAATPQNAAAPLALADIQAPGGQTTTMNYRLAYANEQALQPYALARWSMPPAQLVGQRVRATLGHLGPVVALGESPTAHVLQLSLEEFGQRFGSPQSSQGVVVLRATLLKGEQLVAQRVFTSSAPAPSPDAPGGVRALSQATDAVAQQLAAWVGEKTR